MSLLKLGIAFIIAAVGFMGGHYVATNKAVAAQALAVQKVMGAKKEVEDTLTEERLTWSKERAELNRIAAQNLQTAYDEAATKEAALRKKLRAAEAKYQTKIKELEDAKSKADSIVDDTSPDGGLWIDVTKESCNAPSSTRSDKADGVSKATGPTSGSSAYLRCRIAPEPAKALVKIADTSDQRTELLNKCIGNLAERQSAFLEETLVPEKETK